MTWDRSKALHDRKAKTRDGRRVYDLRETILEGKTVLIGRITTPRKTKRHGTIVIESAYWASAGLGLHGGDDLINV